MSKKEIELPAVDESEFKTPYRGGHRTGSRKLRESVREICEELGCNPVEFLCLIVNGDKWALSTDDSKKPQEISLELRNQAAKTLMDFMFSKNFTVKGDKDNPIQFKGSAAVDYNKLAKMIKDAKGE